MKHIATIHRVSRHFDIVAFITNMWKNKITNKPTNQHKVSASQVNTLTFLNFILTYLYVPSRNPTVSCSRLIICGPTHEIVEFITYSQIEFSNQCTQIHSETLDVIMFVCSFFIFHIVCRPATKASMQASTKRSCSDQFISYYRLKSCRFSSRNRWLLIMHIG